MDWAPIQIMKITPFFVKSSIGNLLEVIKYKITGLQHSQLLQKKKLQWSNGGNGEGTDWLATGITYLLPKSGDSKEVCNYQPITCLTTVYKT